MLLGALVLAFLLFAPPLAADAQEARPVPRIGWLGLTPANSPRAQYNRDFFRQGLRENGWMEGQNVTIEYRSAEDRPERLADLAADLVRLPVDVLVGSGEVAIHALRREIGRASCRERV